MRTFARFTVILLSVAGTNVWGIEEDSSFANYDAIVAELRDAAEERNATPATNDLDWDEVAIHGGVGLTTTYLHINTPDGAIGAGLLKGIEGHFGVNLFSRNVRAEGAFRNYIQGDLSSSVAADLKEFELRVVFTPVIADKTLLRLGGGVAARYLTVNARGESYLAEYAGSTPSSSLMLGLERKLSPGVALGPDFGYRSSMISDTLDKSAWNASLRLNATF